MPYVTADTLDAALESLKGSADHFLKIWFVLKQMGMANGNAVKVDTVNSTNALERLYDYNAPDGRFYVPFAHATKYLTMKPDAGRSIIQTNLNKWIDGAVSSVDPTDYLSIEKPDGAIVVGPGRKYPEGLGFGKDGFALSDGARLEVPLASFAVWYYRQHTLPDGADLPALEKKLSEDLNLSSAEIDLVFSRSDAPDLLGNEPFGEQPLRDGQVFNRVNAAIKEGADRKEAVEQTFSDYANEVRSMVTRPDEGQPQWVAGPPRELLKRTFESGSKAVLLYGPPRTGKTRAALSHLQHSDGERIQIHDGWGYDELMTGLRPKPGGDWEYRDGPLLRAIKDEKEYVVLEEINRTNFSQAIGEVFSLIEEGYRGPGNAITLRNGESFHIPKSTTIVCTMNTLDRSTESVDDALFGRLQAIEFRPRVEQLSEILSENGINQQEREQWRELFAHVQQFHPVGHGFFAPLKPGTKTVDFYRTRLRPVLQKHLAGYRDEDLDAVDEKVNQLFAEQI